MRKPAFRFVALIVAAFALGSCRSSPVYYVESASMATSPTATLEQVTLAIKRAGGMRGWQMVEVSPGLIEGHLNVRSHKAVVTVKFDTKAFSILYKDSANLKYTGTNIHSNYNSWVQNLEKAILAQTMEM